MSTLCADHDDLPSGKCNPLHQRDAIGCVFSGKGRRESGFSRSKEIGADSRFSTVSDAATDTTFRCSRSTPDHVHNHGPWPRSSERFEPVSIAGSRGSTSTSAPTGKAYSLHGDPFENEADAERILRAIQGRVAEGTPKSLAVERYLPTHSRAHRVELWLARWLKEIEALVEAGERSEGTLREYKRWASPKGCLRLSHAAGSPLDSEPRLASDPRLADGVRVRGKTLRNVTAALSSFLGWLVKVGVLESTPKIPWPAFDEMSQRSSAPSARTRFSRGGPPTNSGCCSAWRCWARATARRGC